MKALIEKYVGKTGTIKTGGLVVRVKITDVKVAYGNERYMVTPVEGQGFVWVETVTLEK